MDASLAALILWQTAGAGLVVPQAWLTATQAGTAAPIITKHVEAFQPDGGPAPAPARTSAGVYTFGYAATYLDEQGNASPLQLSGGIAVAMGATWRHGQVEIGGDTHSCTVRFWSDAGVTPADCASFFVLLW
jgi:hypothetical protein